MSTYLEAGVNLDAAAGWVGRLKKIAPGIGGFSGSYPLGEDDLVASTDGVGTKLKLAIALNRHDTIGIDLVAMNVNDILTSGAKPLFFLDYIAVSHLDPEKMEKVVAGIFKGCEIAGCALIGGETAQMPGLYQPGDYDLAGFAVGIVNRKKRIDGSGIKPGDLLVGLPSSGVHSNGFSLVRQIIGENYSQSLGEDLLTPTKIYVREVLEMMQRYTIKGMAHITGGSFEKNIPRMLPKGLGAEIYEGSWPIPEVFRFLQKTGNVSDTEMRRVFNRGIGYVLAMSPEEARQTGHCIIGKAIEGEGIVWR